MTKEEHDNWITRATPFIGQEYPVRVYDEKEKKNIQVMSVFTKVIPVFLMKEQQKGDKGKPINYPMPKALLSRDKKQANEPLDKIVLYFEANG